MKSAQDGIPQPKPLPDALPGFLAEATEIDADGYPINEGLAVRPKLTLRQPDEILAMEFDDSDIILGDRLLAKGQSLVIAAQGGAGKSRLLLQLAASVVSGRKFLGLETRGRDLRWLILQTENSNRRLKDDLGRLKAWLGSDDWKRFNEQVTIHTIETDTDGFVSLDHPENIRNIETAIAETQPDIIVIDPLGEFSIRDIDKDADMKATLQALSGICRRGNPQRALIVLHHAITGRGGAVKVTGYDRSSFARNSKALHAWTRGQINLAPVDQENYDRLIVACGKCSNGKEFPTFAIGLNTQTMIYESDPTVNVKEWEKMISGGSDREPLMTPDRVRELCKPGSNKSALAQAIMQDCGCVRQSAYRYITRAAQKKKIALNKTDETYSPL